MHLVLLGALDGILTAGVYALMASGLTLVFGVMNVVNVGQAGFVVAAAYLSYELQNRFHVGLLVGLLISVPLLFLCGYAVERLLLTRLKGDRELMGFLMTFAVLLVLQGLITVLFGAGFIQLHASYITSTFDIAGFRLPKVYLIAFGVSIAVFGGLHVLLRHTQFGATLRAATQNELGAKLVGIDFAKVSALTFALGTALAAVGGMFYGATQTVDPSSMYDLIAILLAIVIFGGLGSMAGTLIASVVLLMVQDITAAVWSPDWASIMSYAVLGIVLIVRPRGLFGQKVLRAQ